MYCCTTYNDDGCEPAVIPGAGMARRLGLPTRQDPHILAGETHRLQDDAAIWMGGREGGREGGFAVKELWLVSHLHICH